MKSCLGFLGCLFAAVLLAGCPSQVGPGDAADGDVTNADAMNDTMPPEDIVDVIEDDSPAPSAIGNACTGSGTPMPGMGDCPDGEICLDEAQGFPFGYCIQQCDVDACPAMSACVVIGGRFSLCLRTCTINEDCREMDGYTCQATMSGDHVCLPAGAPVGERDGGACYTTTPGMFQLPALQRSTFMSANLSASADRTDSNNEAEGNVAINPMTGNATLSYIAVSRGGAFMGTSTTPDGTMVLENGTVRDPMLSTTSDPVLAYTANGTLHMVFLGYNYDASGQPTGMRMRIADSTDNGATWSAARAIEPDGTCTGGCDKPWIAVGPGPDGTGEVIYVAWLVQSRASARLVIESSSDGGMTWSMPHTVATGPETVGGSQVLGNLNTLAIGTDGVIHITYVGLTIASMTANYGDVDNRIVYRRSMDGGVTWGPGRRVSATMDSPVYNQPMIALDGSTIYIAYVSGGLTGAWDIQLATSVDGGNTWGWRKVNDEPDACATHAFPALVADTTRHVAHVTWMENRFGTMAGAVAYASCPQDRTMRCSTNEQVTDMPFTFTTSRDPREWHGDYMGLNITATGDLWAGWSDTRSGNPHMYMSHGVPH